MNSLFQLIQKKSLPGVWSKGVTLSRDGFVTLLKKTEKEITLKIKSKDKPVSHEVNLWIEDEDYYCSCESKVDPCEHVIASVNAIKNNLLTQTTDHMSTPDLYYNLICDSKKTSLTRTIDGKELKEPLYQYIGGIDSGRIKEKKPNCTQIDFKIDQLITQSTLENKIIPYDQIFKILIGHPFVTFNSEKCEIRPKIDRFKVIIKKNENQTFHISIKENPLILKSYDHQIIKTEMGVHMGSEPLLNSEAQHFFSTIKNAGGKNLNNNELIIFVTEIFPHLYESFINEDIPPDFPKINHEPPTIQFKIEPLNTDSIAITPKILYLNSFSVKNIEKENELKKKIKTVWNLSPFQVTLFKDTDALQILDHLKNENLEIQENTKTLFTKIEDLSPTLKIEGNIEDFQYNLEFSTPSLKKINSSDLFTAWKLGKSVIPLLGGGFGKLPLDWFEKYGNRLEKILSQSKTQPQKMRLPELFDLSHEMNSSLHPTLLEYREKFLTPTKIIPKDFPKALTVELRDYQKEGVNWLCFLRDLKIGALLADDMGLGKTLQTLCALKGRSLIIAPTSVLSNWQNQIKSFRPDLTVHPYFGTNRKLKLDSDVLLTSYGVLRNEREFFIENHWDTIVIDEAQNIKNSSSQIAKIAHELKGDFRLALSGTPVENDLEDLWSQFQFINPGLLGTKENFSKEDITFIQKKVKPFILRRLKKEVAKELPLKTEMILENELSESERNLYDSLLLSQRKEVVEKLMSGEITTLSALELLLRLRQACCHPSLIPGEYAESSSKCDLLFEHLEASIKEGHKSLVFSQWTSYLDILEIECKKKNISYLRLDGETKNRSELIDHFQSPSGPPLFLISLKAGGVGITLTEADHVYLMDSWWNPAVAHQAADRAHRIGQKRPVFVYRIISKNTIEEKILKLQASKKSLSDQILSGTAQTGKLTKEDIIELLT